MAGWMHCQVGKASRKIFSSIKNLKPFFSLKDILDSFFSSSFASSFALCSGYDDEDKEDEDDGIAVHIKKL